MEFIASRPPLQEVLRIFKDKENDTGQKLRSRYKRIKEGINEGKIKHFIFLILKDLKENFSNNIDSALSTTYNKQNEPQQFYKGQKGWNGMEVIRYFHYL